MIARILGALCDHHYRGALILEIDDLNFEKPLSAGEKCTVLARDLVFMRDCMEPD